MLSLQSNNVPSFHLDVMDFAALGVVQLAVVADGVVQTLNGIPTNGPVNDDEDAESAPSAVLAIQLDKDQLRDLIDHLEAFATPQGGVEDVEEAIDSVVEAVADLCGKGPTGCPPRCCDEPRAPFGYPPLTMETLADKLLGPVESQESVLEEAQRIVHGPRRAVYGHPKKNFGRIADLWNAYMAGKNDDWDGLLNEIDIAMLMTLLKIARLLHDQNDRDGLVDISGYAACAALISGVDAS